MRIRSRIWLLPTVVTYTLTLLGCGILGASRGLMWAGEWAWTMDWANGLSLSGGPFAAAMAAAALHRYEDTGLRQLARQSTSGGLLLPLLLGCVAGAAALAWLSAAGVLVAITSVLSALSPRHLGWLALGAAAMLGYVAAGVLVGRLASRSWAAPGAFVLTFVLSSLAARGTIPPVFRVGGSSGTLAGQVVSERFIAWAVLAHLLLVVAACLVVSSGEAVRPRRWRILATVAAVGFIGVAVSPLRPPERLVPDPDVHYRCAGDVVQTCMALDTSRQLELVARGMDAYARELRTLGLSLPRRFVQLLPELTPAREDGMLVVGAQNLNNGDGIGLVAAEAITVPAACPQYSSPDGPSAALQAQSIMAAYLRFRLDPQGFPPPPGSRLEAWMAGPAEQWTVETYPLLRGCELDDVTVPDV